MTNEPPTMTEKIKNTVGEENEDLLDIARELLKVSGKSIQSRIQLANKQIDYLRLVQVSHENLLYAASDRLSKVKTITSRLCDECFSLLPVLGKSFENLPEVPYCYSVNDPTLPCCSCSQTMVRSSATIELPSTMISNGEFSLARQARERVEGALKGVTGATQDFGGVVGSETGSGMNAQVNTGVTNPFTFSKISNFGSRMPNVFGSDAESGINFNSALNTGPASPFTFSSAPPPVVGSGEGSAGINPRVNTGVTFWPSSASPPAFVSKTGSETNAKAPNPFTFSTSTKTEEETKVGMEGDVAKKKHRLGSGFEPKMEATTKTAKGNPTGLQPETKAKLVELAQNYRDQTAATLYKTEFALREWEKFLSQHQEEFDKIEISLQSVTTKQKKALQKKLCELGVGTTTKSDCPICFELPNEIVFQCGHQSCRNCSPRITKCHTCREGISQRIKLYH